MFIPIVGANGAIAYLNSGCVKYAMAEKKNDKYFIFLGVDYNNGKIPSGFNYVLIPRLGETGDGVIPMEKCCFDSYTEAEKQLYRVLKFISGEI